MGSVVLDFLRKYNAMTVSVFGKKKGTILTYLAPGITYFYLNAKKDFCLYLIKKNASPAAKSKTDVHCHPELVSGFT